MKNRNFKSYDKSHFITTKRLILRPLRLSDFSVWQYAHSQVTHRRNQFDKSHLPKSQRTRAKYISRLKRYEKARKMDKYIEFAIFDRKTGELLGGVIIFTLLRLIFKQGMLGYYLLGKNWGKGIALEANAACISYAFKHFDFHRLIALIDKSNPRSQSLARRLGMKREGNHAQSVFERGRWKNSQCWVLLNKKK